MFLVDFLSYITLLLFQQILRFVPETKKRIIGIWLGRLAYYLLKERRKIAEANIKKVFGAFSEKELKSCAKKVFENLGINAVEILSFPFLNKNEYEKRFKLKIEEKAHDALKRRGILALGFHYANWEIMGVISKLLRREIVALARPLKGYRLLDRFVTNLRSQIGLTTIPNRGTSKDVFKLIKEGKIVAILADQREKRSKCVNVEFFGEKAPTTKSIVLIALRTGAPVLPVYPVREGFLRYTFVISNPIEMEKDGILKELIYRNSRKINSFLETLIVKSPEEWFWVHRRWRRKENH